MGAYGGPGDLPEEERGSVGFPRGNSPEEFRANMLTFFKETLAKISKPVVDRATPSFDNDRNMFGRVPYKSEESLRFFVLHQIFSDIGFVGWARQQEDSFIFPHLQACADPAHLRGQGWVSFHRYVR